MAVSVAQVACNTVAATPRLDAHQARQSGFASLYENCMPQQAVADQYGQRQGAQALPHRLCAR